MWEAATAMFAVCVRKGRSGGYRGLGKMPTLSFGNRIVDLINATLSR